MACGRIRLGFAAATVLVAGFTAGCSSDVVDPGAESWKEEIKAAIPLATSEWEREVLELAAQTGKISDADYLEAVNQQIQCYADHGVTMEYRVDSLTGLGSFSTSYDNDEFTQSEFEAISKTCDDTTPHLVQSFYNSIKISPNNGDPNEEIAACLVNAGMAPEGYTGADFLNDITGKGSPPYDMADRRVDMCMAGKQPTPQPGTTQ